MLMLLLDGFRKFDQEEENTSNLSQFTLANGIYAALVEGHAAENSARCVNSIIPFNLY